ncbi:DUF4238 domain-containing protein [Gemmatimonadota bacterium]
MPRFLLNRFASRRKGEKAWIWQYSPSEGPVEISTKDAAVSKHFYGRADSAVEDAFATIEGRLDSVLSRVQEGEDPNSLDSELRILVWTLAVRTRALRSHLKDLGQATLPGMSQILTDARFHELVVRELRSNLDQMISEGLADRSFILRLIVRVLLKVPWIRAGVLRIAERQIRSGALDEFMLASLDFFAFRIPWESAAARGHNVGIAKLLLEGIPPNVFSPTSWSFQGTSSLVLGDSCVVAFDSEGQVGNPLRFLDSWECAVLPVSPSQALVAHRFSDTTSPSSENINAASASLSQRFLWAAEESQAALRLAKQIGSASPVLDHEELLAIIREALDDQSRQTPQHHEGDG